MANRYWVGGTGNWSDTAHWSLTSGGSGGETVPSIAEDVLFDSASGIITDIVTIDASSTALTLTTTGFIGTLTGTFDLTIASTVLIDAANIWTYTGVLSLVQSTGANLTTNGIVLDNLTINNTAGQSATLQSNTTVTNAVTLTQGTFNLNNKTNSFGSFSSSNTNTRVIQLGTATLTLSGTGTIWDVSTATNLTVTASTSLIACSDTTNALTFKGGGKTYARFSRTGIGGGQSSSMTFTGTNSFSTCTLINDSIIFTDKQSATTWGFSSNTKTTTLTGNIGGGGLMSSKLLKVTNSVASNVGVTVVMVAQFNGGGNTGWKFLPVPSSTGFSTSDELAIGIGCLGCGGIANNPTNTIIGELNGSVSVSGNFTFTVGSTSGFMVYWWDGVLQAYANNNVNIAKTHTADGIKRTFTMIPYSGSFNTLQEANGTNYGITRFTFNELSAFSDISSLVIGHQPLNNMNKFGIQAITAVESISLTATSLTTLKTPTCSSLEGFWTITGNTLLTSLDLNGFSGGSGATSGSYYLHDMSTNALTATALNNMFTSLGTAHDYNSIDVHGNPGAATCDPTIATLKNWTVITS